MTETWVKVGHVGTDGGVVRIGDKNYVGSMEYRGARESWNDVEHQDVWFGLCPGLDIVSGHGDGCYPIYASFDDEGRPKQVLIRFDESEYV